MKRFKLHRNEAVLIDQTTIFTMDRIRCGVTVCKFERLDGTLQTVVPLRPGMGVDINTHLSLIVERIGWFGVTFRINAESPSAVVPFAYPNIGEDGTLPHIAPDMMGTPRVGGDDIWS